MYNKVNRFWMLVFVLLALSTFTFSGLVRAAELSADTKMVMPGMNGKKMITNGKVAVKGKMERRETAGPIQMIVITRRDKGLMWMLSPAQKTYNEMKIPNIGPELTLEQRFQQTPGFKKAGKSRVAGYSCNKYTFEDKQKTMSGTLYISPVLNYQLKSETKMFGMNTSSELTNIKECKQTDSLFNIPKGYKLQKIKPFNGPGMGGKGTPKFPGMFGNKQHSPK